MEEGVKRGIAISITILILLILLITGPAQAVILGLTTQDTVVQKGELTNFEAKAEVEYGETLQIQYFTLKLTGPQLIECKFLPNATIISGCDHVYIEKISIPPYGYGYGYSQGFFKFNITLDTSYFQPGIYQTYLILSGQQPTQYRGQDLTITTLSPQDLAGCSIRASGGSLMSQGELFGSGKLNFHVPLGNANNGKGSLVGQKGRDRFSYTFDVLSVNENNEFFTNITVKGECKINNEKTIKTAYIYYNKLTNTISVSCPDLSIEDMTITFKKYC